jgi:hypothetical protein
MKRHRRLVIPVVVLLAGGASGAFSEQLDFGALVEAKLHELTAALFGVAEGLLDSAPLSERPYRRPAQDGEDQLLLAAGLGAELVTRSAAELTTSLLLHPPGAPTHLITCASGRRQVIGTHANGSRLNPSVQRIDLATGAVVTILRGLDRCGSVIATPWGTVLATEESADRGRL